MFVVAAAEDPPAELIGRVDALTIAFPWGSLLRGALALDDRAADGIHGLLAPKATATILLAPAPRDRLGDLPTAADLLDPRSDACGSLAERWRCLGLSLCDLRRATIDEVEATQSTWARRLRAGRDADRPVVRFQLRRSSGGCLPRGASFDGLRVRRALRRRRSPDRERHGTPDQVACPLHIARS